MTLIPERFLRFAIRDLENKSNFNRTEEHEFWLKRLHEYYAINHGDLKENAEIDKRLFIAEMADEIKNSVLTIDLDDIFSWDYEPPCLVTQDEGINLRERVQLDSEDWHGYVNIIFPMYSNYDFKIEFIVSDFFLSGFLKPSLAKFNSASEFYRKFSFGGPTSIIDDINTYVREYYAFNNKGANA